LGMKVLTYMELKQTNKGFDVFLAYQKQKEALAKLYQAGANESRVRGLLSL